MPQLFLPLRLKINARPKSRVALRATRPSAAVAENGHFNQNVAPAQQLIISLVHDARLAPGVCFLFLIFSGYLVPVFGPQ